MPPQTKPSHHAHNGTCGLKVIAVASQVRLISMDIGMADVAADDDGPVTGEAEYKESVTGDMAYSQQARLQHV